MRWWAQTPPTSGQINRPLSPFDTRVVPQASLFAKGAAVANYPGVAHGFAIRGDWTDPNVADKRQQALQNAITFFSAVLGDPTGT